MAQTNDKEIQEIKQNLYKLERALVCADENGLFRITTDSPKFMDIVENIGLAKKALENEKNLSLEKLLVAWKMYRLANHQYHQVINSANFWWKFKYQFGGHFIIYFFILLGFIIISWYFYGSSLVNVEILLVPIWAYSWGMVGGILQGLWFLWQHVNHAKMRKAWAPWYIFLPFMGALLGALMYLIFSSGFIATTGQAEIQSESFVILLSAIAGFSTRWAIESLDKLTKLIRIGK